MLSLLIMIIGPKLVEFQDVDSSLMTEARKLIAFALQSSVESNEPKLIHMCGIPGAGKTTYANAYISINRELPVVQFDAVMEQLSGYRQDRAQLGLVEAFSKWELPARAIGYHLLQALVEANRNVFFDHSAISLTHVDLITAIKKRGYSVEMHYIECAPDEAVLRVNRREKLIQRHTPEKLIHERHALLQELLPVYETLVDRFEKVTLSSILPPLAASAATATANYS